MFFVVKYQTEEAVAMTESRQTYDTPWKQIIEFFFPSSWTFLFRDQQKILTGTSK